MPSFARGVRRACYSFPLHGGLNRPLPPRWIGVGKLAAVLVSCFFSFATNVHAQTDEIQVYDAEINNPGQFNVVLHNNYTPRGRTQSDFQGGMAPNHALNGAAEWAYGVREWLEVGTYLPLYSITGEGSLVWNGAKLRALFVAPHASERLFFYGINFEFSYNALHWESTRTSGEIRLIFGSHLGPVDLIVNPIMDTSFNGIRQLDFAPSERIAYNFSGVWAAALEHYADYGHVKSLEPVDQQEQELFAVVDYKGDQNGVEVGIGHGFTDGSDRLILKLMVTHNF